MIKRNLVANYLGQAWVALMGLAFVPLYIKFLGIEAYGLIGLFALLQVWLGMLDMGMTPTLSREMARLSAPPSAHATVCTTDGASMRDLLRSIEWIASGTVMLVAVTIAMASDWLASSWLKAQTLPLESVAQAITIMGVVTGLRYLEGLYASALVGLQKQVLLNVVNAGMATIRGIGAVAVLAWLDPSILAFFIWQAIASMATLVILAVTAYISLPPASRAGRFSLQALRKVWRFAGGMVIITLLALLLTQMDKLLLSNLLTFFEYGYYMLAAVLAGGLYMLVHPVTQAWFPLLSQLQAQEAGAGARGGSGPALVRAYHQGAQVISVIVGSAAVILIVFSETVLRLWIQDYALARHTAPLVSLLALGNLIHALMWIPYQTQLAHGWTSLAARMNGIALLFVVPALLWATPRYGATGAAWVWVALNAGFVMIGAHFMYRRILKGEKWRWYWQDNFQPLIAATAVAILVKYFSPGATGVVMQLIELAIASVLALAAALIVAPELRKYVVLYLSNKLIYTK